MAFLSTARWSVSVVFVGVITAAAGCGRGDAGDYRAYAELKSPAAVDAAAPSSAASAGPSDVSEGRETVGSQTPVPASESAAAIEAVKPQPADAEAPEAANVETAVGGPSEPPPADVNAALPAEAVEAPLRKVELLVKERTFQTVGPEEALRVTYDDIDLLKVLNMEPVTPEAPDLFPDWLKSLDGRRVRIRGFMIPHYMEEGIQNFVLARDNQICCFGKDPKIYDVFDVRLRNGVTTRYIQSRPFDVVGVFHIQPEADDGKLYQLYRIDDAILIEK